MAANHHLCMSGFAPRTSSITILEHIIPIKERQSVMLFGASVKKPDGKEEEENPFKNYEYSCSGSKQGISINGISWEDDDEFSTMKIMSPLSQAKRKMPDLIDFLSSDKSDTKHVYEKEEENLFKNYDYSCSGKQGINETSWKEDDEFSTMNLISPLLSSQAKRKLPELIDFLSSDKSDAKHVYGKEEENSFKNNEYSCSEKQGIINEVSWEDDAEEFSTMKLISPLSQAKRKMPELIDFLSSDKSINAKHVDQESELSDEISVELQSATELSLCFGPPMSKKRKIFGNSSNVSDLDLSIGYYSPLMDRERNMEPGLPDQCFWKIKKVLKKSDCDGSSRLLLGRELVQEHILPHVMGNRAAFDNDAKGIQIAIWDVDTRTNHTLILKLWNSTGSFVLTRNWRSEFVKRRQLEEKDEVGLRWDADSSRLEFTLLTKGN